MFFQKTSRKSSWLLAAALALSAGFASRAAIAAPADKKDADLAGEDLRKIVERHGPAIFGGKVSVKDDRFTLIYEADGQFAKGFDYKQVDGGPRYDTGVIAQRNQVDRSIKGRLVDERDGKFAFAGIKSGQAISRFELADDFTIEFKLRITRIQPNAQMSWRFNQQRSRYIETDFFRSLRLKGKRRAVIHPKNKMYRLHPLKWFDTKSKGVPVKVKFHDGEFSIRMAAKKGEIKVGLDDIDHPASGKISFVFSNLNFAVSDLKISGKLPTGWLREEIARLDKEGKLAPEPEAVARRDERPHPADGKGDEKKDRDKEAAKEKAKPKDFDPEADDDL